MHIDTFQKIQFLLRQDELVRDGDLIEDIYVQGTIFMVTESNEAKAIVETSDMSNKSAKNNKAARIIQLRANSPGITNVKVAETVGCSQTYSSKIWSDHMKANGKGKTTKSRKTRTVTRKAKKQTTTTAPRKATTTTSTSATEAFIADRRAIACMVSRLGSCAVKSLVADVTSE